MKAEFYHIDTLTIEPLTLWSAGFKSTSITLLGHLISHKSYHYSPIGNELARIGFPLDKITAYGMWKGGVPWIR